MSTAEIIAVLVDAGILGAVLWYAWVANEQRKITVEALKLQKEVRQDELDAKDVRFESRQRVANLSQQTIELVNRDPDIVDWNVSPVEIQDAMWRVQPAKDDLWKSDGWHALRFHRVEGAQGDPWLHFRIEYKTGSELDSTTKCFRIVKRGVVPETCPESEHFYVA